VSSEAKKALIRQSVGRCSASTEATTKKILWPQRLSRSAKQCLSVLFPGPPPHLIIASDLPKPNVEYRANDGLDPQRTTGGSSCDLSSTSDVGARDATLHWG